MFSQIDLLLAGLCLLDGNRTQDTRDKVCFMGVLYFLMAKSIVNWDEK